MSAPKFTPGPWVANGLTIEDKAVRTAVVASLYDERDGVYEWRANAALIAAAPELYAALYHLAGLFASLHEKHAEWGDYQAALAALAKARGES